MRTREHQRVWTRYRSFGRSLRWEVEYEFLDGWSRATWPIPKWARSPAAGIIGEAIPVRKRLTWLRVPLSPWRDIRTGGR